MARGGNDSHSTPPGDHNQKGKNTSVGDHGSNSAVVPCSGTESSFNNYEKGPQNFKDAKINSGLNSGLNLKGVSSHVATASGRESTKSLNNHCSGTRSSFNCHGNASQSFKGAVINSGKNSGHHGGSGSAAGASNQQRGVSGTRDSFNNYASGSNSQDFTRAKINSGENSGDV